MANYLQRIIMAGARIQSSAKPPAQVPAIVPSIVAPPLTSPSEGQAADALGEVAERISSPVPAPIADEPPVPTEPVAREERTIPVAEPSVKSPIQRPVPLSVAIARMTSGTRIRAPKALRPRTPMAEPSPMKAPGIEATKLMAAVTSRNVPSAPPASATPTQATKPATAAPSVPESKTVVQPGNNSGANLRPEPERSSAAMEFRAIQINPRPLQSPAAPVVAGEERGLSRQSRITIGKVDVQVNNQRPARNAVPSRKPSGGPRLNFLEARYLSRFPMRP